MAIKLTEAQIKELRTAFDMMDQNKDGKVTRDELVTLLKGLGEDYSPEVVDEMIRVADKNNDGVIDFEEFCQASQTD